MIFLYDKFSKDIKSAMATKSVSYRDLAKGRMFSHSTLWRQVKNARLMSVQTTFYICHQLDLSIFDYIDDEYFQTEMF